MARRQLHPHIPGSPAQGKRPLIISSANGLHALDKGMDILKKGGDTLDAVVAAVTIVEDDPTMTPLATADCPTKKAKSSWTPASCTGRRTAPARSRVCVASKMFRALRKRSWRKPTT